MTPTEKKYLHVLKCIPGIGTAKILLLEHHFDSFEAAWSASLTELEEAGISPKLANTLDRARLNSDPDTCWQHMKEHGIDLLYRSTDSFPEKLKDVLGESPPLLYVRGDESLLSEPAVAIVGSRKHSTYGAQAGGRLAGDLAEAGVHIISGLALGIDALAHEAALAPSTPGKTIAILGGGIDDASLTPKTNARLAQKILSDGGCLVSEYPPGTPPSAGTFPARNRIMAALADATLVIEAAADSGTLITAGHAKDFGRPVFAIPGSIFLPEAVGTNTLIAEGTAQLTQTASDILRALHVSHKERAIDKAGPSQKEEKEIYAALESYPEGLSIDKLIRITTLEGSVVSRLLITMELDGHVKNIGGGNYVRC